MQQLFHKHMAIGMIRGKTTRKNTSCRYNIHVHYSIKYTGTNKWYQNVQHINKNVQVAVSSQFSICQINRPLSEHMLKNSKTMWNICLRIVRPCETYT